MNLLATYPRLYLMILTLTSLLTLPTHASAPAPTRSQANFEVKFLTGMIDHHAMAVEMAEVCLEKAVHPELEELCSSIIEAQTSEIELMQGWLANWYGVTYAPQMKRGDQKMIDRLAQLSGEEFEIEFMEMMIMHHEKAIREATTCEHRAFHAELKQLCASIIATQSEEIEQMQTWLCHGMASATNDVPGKVALRSSAGRPANSL